MKRYFYTLVALVLILSFAAQSAAMRVGYPEFKPYTYTEGGEAKGLGIEVFRQIGKDLSLKFELVPIETHGNGFTRLSKGKLDAVLLATANESRDKTARFSSPIAENTWSWFFIADKDKDYQALIKDKNLKVASITNTNTHNWLIKNQYKRISATIDITAMLRQIDRGRIDAIFIAEHVLLNKLETLNLNREAFHVQRQLKKPFGIYVAHQYLASRPDFMSQLNQQILKQTNSKEVSLTLLGN